MADVLDPDEFFVTQARQRAVMQKKEFERLATACQEIEAGLVALSMPLPKRNDIMELVVARIATVCAADNKNFDSFKFNAVARKRRE